MKISELRNLIKEEIQNQNEAFSLPTEEEAKQYLKDFLEEILLHGGIQFDKFYKKYRLGKGELNPAYTKNLWKKIEKHF